MKSVHVTGGGGVRLHAIETGNPAGRPILFLHGLSQCCLAWSRQLNSDLATDHRLVAIDLRGHGLSEKPRDAYSSSKLWADDVAGAIRSLALDSPILCGWSYGALVILDYIREHGDDNMGGIQFVGGVSKLGSEEAMSVLMPQFVALVPGFFASDVEQSVSSLQALIRMCVRDLSEADLYLLLGANLSVPPHVRQAMLSRVLDNDDVLRRIRKPALLTHGTDDAVVSPAAVDRHKAILAHAQVHMMPSTGHAPFWDEAAAFNRRLRQFAASL